MNFALLKWLTVLLSLYGTVLNVRKDRRCFYVWTATNAAWVAIDVWHGVYEQASLHLVYTGLSVYGIVSWRRTCD